MTTKMINLGLLSPMPYRRLFAWLAPEAFIASKLIGPVGQFFLFIYVARTNNTYDVTFVVVGAAVLLTMFGGTYGITFSMLNANRSGVVRDARVAPSGLMGLYVPLALWSAIDSLVTSCVVIAIGASFYGISIVHTVGFAIALLVVSATSAALGVVIAEVALFLHDDAGSLVNTMVVLTTLLSGALIANDDLPSWLQPITAFWPFAHGLQAARNSAIGDGWARPVFYEVLVILVLAVLGTLVHIAAVRSLSRGGRPE